MAKQKLFDVTIKDCIVECIASTGGAGGQNKNRRHTAVRITHPPSGAKGFSADEREQLRNKQVAFKRMASTKEFQTWCRVEASRLAGEKPIEVLLEEALSPANLKIEGRNSSGNWVPLPPIEDPRSQ